ncbi:MAG: tetratricopeptide repeat protein [Spirochaetales bacterium]|nr:tetratricopeptide repeat protein [Spirochaetales bacterium]
MRVFLFIIFSISAFVYSCSSAPVPLKVHYDQKRELYIAVTGPRRGAVLRDKEGNIIRDESEKNALLEEIGDDPENPASVVLELEKSTLFVRQEHRIAFLYFSGVKEINKGNYFTAIEHFQNARRLYPELIYYSDISFLLGYCYEKTDSWEKAVGYYQLFINKSPQKYSRRFLEIDRIRSDLYREQLLYARSYINHESPPFHELFTKNETVKYYNNYMYPGFEVGLYPGIRSVGFSFIPDFHNIMESFVYVGASYTFNRWFDAGGMIGFPDPLMCEVSADFQLFRAADRRYGISLETSLFYLLKDDITADGETIVLEPPLHFINSGIKIGIGYYILPDLFMGGYYQYNLFNEYFKFEFSANGATSMIWNSNSYGITIRYLFLKNADLDLSFRKGELYSGANVYFYSYNLFVGYAFFENRFVIMLNSIDLIK